MEDRVVTPAAVATAATKPQAGQLRAGALGLPSVLFCIVTGAAPLAAMIFNVPVAVLGGGYAAPAAFLIATVALTIFSVGYIEMSQRVQSTGGFYTFITRGLGSVMGMGTGVLIALCYVVFTCAVLGTMAYFASTSINTWTGIDLPAWVYMIVGLALMSALAFFDIELTAKVLGVALVTEVIALLVLAIGILLSSTPDGYSAAPLNPFDLFDNSSAIKAFGAGATGIAIFGAFWSWVGFEMAPNFAEESRDPKRIAKAATYISVIGLGLFYIFISYMFVTGWGLNGASTAVNSQFKGEIASAFYPLSDKYVGGGLTTALQALAITSSFACAMAFFNTSARYLYALSRERILPAPLARTHPGHQSPYIAASVVTVLVGLYCLGFVIYDPSTEAALLKLGTWSPLLGVLGILAVQGICSVAIIRYFLTTARDGFHVWKTLIAPILGTVMMFGACYLLIANRGSLSGAGDAGYIKVLPYVPVVMFLIGVVIALYLRAKDQERYSGIGRFAHDVEVGHDAPTTTAELAPAGS
jgi:amino acid transporter